MVKRLTSPTDIELVADPVTAPAAVVPKKGGRAAKRELSTHSSPSVRVLTVEATAALKVETETGTLIVRYSWHYLTAFVSYSYRSEGRQD